MGRFLYPNPSDLEVNRLEVDAKGLGRNYWLYLVGVGLVAAGFADFPLVAYHFQSEGLFAESTIPLLYAAAMAVDALSALFFGWLYDRIGVKSLIPAALISSCFAPLVFLGGTAAAWAGVIVWGIGMGWQESIMRSVVSDMAPSGRRASAFGVFNAGYGILWFAGSWALGSLYDASISQRAFPGGPGRRVGGGPAGSCAGLYLHFGEGQEVAPGESVIHGRNVRGRLLEEALRHLVDQDVGLFY